MCSHWGQWTFILHRVLNPCSYQCYETEHHQIITSPSANGCVHIDGNHQAFLTPYNHHPNTVDVFTLRAGNINFAECWTIAATCTNTMKQNTIRSSHYPQLMDMFTLVATIIHFCTTTATWTNACSRTPSNHCPNTMDVFTVRAVNIHFAHCIQTIAADRKNKKKVLIIKQN